MASTYVNDLRLNEMATGDASGSWGTVTNTNLELIGEAFSYGTETIGDADSTLTIADGAADAARSFYLKITSSVDLTTTRIVTLGPNTVSKVWMIENATTGSQVITIKQGSGATINVPNGQVKMISTDGAGSGGAVLDLLVDVDLTGTTTLVNLDVSGAVDIAGDLTLSAGGDGALRFTAASSVKVLDNNAAALVFEEADNAYMTFVTTDGSEAVKFDKALDINAATQIDAAVTVGVDDTGYDVKFFGATTGKSLLWDESADSLTVAGNLSVDGGTIKLDGNYPVGTGNVALGDTALDSNVSGASNVAIGADALTANTASNNTAVGYQAGYTNNTGALNTFLGYAAGYTNSTGASNTFLGYAAGYATTTGNYNTLVGRAAGLALTEGSANTFVGGYDASTGGSGAEMTTGSNNTILGSYNGNQGGLDIRTASNNIVLSDGDGNPRVIVDSSGNVGIGVAPAAPLNVYNASNPYAKFADAANYFNVGVITSNYGLINSSLPISFQISDAERMRIDSSGGLITNPAAGGHAVFNEAGVDADFRVESATTANALFVEGSSGNVGIGTSSPASDTANELILQVNAPTTFPTLSLSTSRANVSGDNIGKLSFDVLNNTATYRSRAQITTQSAGSTANKYGADMMFFTASDNTTDAAERMRIDSSGDVGIGTSSPTNNAGFTTLGVNGSTGGVVEFRAGDVRQAQIYATTGAMSVGSTTSIPLLLGAANSEAVRIHASGGLSFANTTDVGPYNAVLGYRNNHFTGQRSNTVAAGDTSTVLTLAFNALNGAAIVRVVDTGTVSTSDYFANVYEYFVTCNNTTVTATLKQSQAGGGSGSMITTSTSASTFNVIQTGDASRTTWHDTAIDVLVAAAGNDSHATATITMAANN
jgi:hypothetical protein